MKRFSVVFFSVLVLIAMSTGFVFADAGGVRADCENDAKTVLEDRLQENEETSQDIDLPDKEKILTCIKGIRFNDRYNIGTPNIDGLWDVICDEINSLIDDQLANLQQKYSYEPLPGLSFGFGGDIERTDRLDEWEREKHYEQRSTDVTRDVMDLAKEETGYN